MTHRLVARHSTRTRTSIILAQNNMTANTADNPTKQLETTRRKERPSWPLFCSHWKSWGPLRAIHWLVMWALGKYLGFHVHYVYVNSNRADFEDPNPPEVPKEYETRLVNFADLEPYIDKVPGLSRNFLEHAFEFDDECGASFCGQDLVAYSFNKRSRTIVSDQLDALIPDRFRYVYKSWTHPQHTRKQLSKMCAYVRRFGPKRCFQERSIHYIETHNYPSLLHSYQHPNARSIRMGYVGWITVFGKQIPFNSRRAKWLGFEFVTRDDPGVRQYT